MGFLDDIGKALNPVRVGNQITSTARQIINTKEIKQLANGVGKTLPTIGNYSEKVANGIGTTDRSKLCQCPLKRLKYRFRHWQRSIRRCGRFLNVP